MPRDGAGVYTLPAGYLAISGQTIQPNQHNPPLEDIAASLTNSIARTGVTSVTADIPFSGFKLTGIGDASNDTDALNRQTADARYPQSNGSSDLAINGGFRVNQRGFAGGPLAAGAFGYDRWKASAGGANYSVASGVCTISSGSIEQVIEGLNIFTGTYSINWAGTATCTVDGVAKSKGATFNLTSFANCTIKFSGAGATLSEVMVSRGAFQGFYEVRPYGVELALCQRYYQRRLTPLMTVWGPPSPGALFYSFSFPQTMRAAPTCAVIANPSLSGATNFVVGANGPDGFYTGITATGSEGQFGYGQGGILAFDAEL